MDFEVAWTRKLGECGSDEILLWLAFLPSFQVFVGGLLVSPEVQGQRAEIIIILSVLF